MIPKFRAWINEGEHSRMVKSDQAVMTAIKNCYGGYGVPEGTTGYHYVDTATKPEKYILMQSTGLKDKNGVEIFEGDIVKRSKGEVGYIAYLQQEAGFVVVLKKRDYRLGHRNTGELYDTANEHQIIGNIYENPELLEVGE